MTTITSAPSSSIDEFTSEEPVVVSKEVEADIEIDKESPEYLESQAALIVSSLGPSYRDFVHASETYNFEFFKNESTEFAMVLAQALVNTYPTWPNLFWNKLLTKV